MDGEAEAPPADVGDESDSVWAGLVATLELACVVVVGSDDELVMAGEVLRSNSLEKSLPVKNIISPATAAAIPRATTTG